MLNDDTQRYGLLKDDALIILCTDFKIGVYISKSCLYKQRFWGAGTACSGYKEIDLAIKRRLWDAGTARSGYEEKILL